MSCADCKFLKTSERKCGLGGGAIYYCSKIEEYKNGISQACEKFSRDYSRSSYEEDSIIRDGRNYSMCEINPSVHFIVLIMIIVMGFILKLFM